MADVSNVGVGGSGVGANSANVDVGFAAGTALTLGRLLVAAISLRTTSTTLASAVTTVPAGWTLLAPGGSIRRGTAGWLAVYTKTVVQADVDAAAAGTSYRWVCNTSSTHAGVIEEIVGADATTPIDVTPTSTTSGSGTTTAHVSPAITPATAGALVLRFVTGATATGPVPGTYTWAGAVTPDATGQGTVGTTSATMLGAGHETGPTPAAAIASRQGNSSFGSVYAGIAIAIRPSAGPTFLDAATTLDVAIAPAPAAGLELAGAAELTAAIAPAPIAVLEAPAAAELTAAIALAPAGALEAPAAAALQLAIIPAIIPSLELDAAALLELVILPTPAVDQAFLDAAALLELAIAPAPIGVLEAPAAALLGLTIAPASSASLEAAIAAALQLAIAPGPAAALELAGAVHLQTAIAFDVTALEGTIVFLDAAAELELELAIAASASFLFPARRPGRALRSTAGRVLQAITGRATARHSTPGRPR